MPPPGLSLRAISRTSSGSFVSCSSLTPPLSPTMALSSGSRLGPAGGQQQQQAAVPAGAAAPAAAAPDAAVAEAAAVAAMAGTPDRRSRSRSGSRHGQKAEKEAGSVRRMPKLVPAAAAAADPHEAAAAGPVLAAPAAAPPAKQRDGDAAAGKPPAPAPAPAGASSTASAAAGSALPIPTSAARARGRAGQRGERKGRRSTSGTPSSGSSPAPAGLAAAAAVGQGAAAPEQGLSQRLRAAGVSPEQLERLQEADRLAADLLGMAEPSAEQQLAQQPLAQPRQQASAGQPEQQAPAKQPALPPAVQPQVPAAEARPVARPSQQLPAVQPPPPPAVLPPPPQPAALQPPAPAAAQPQHSLHVCAAPAAAASVQLAQVQPAAAKPSPPSPASRQGSGGPPSEAVLAQAVVTIFRPAPAAEDSAQQAIAAVWQGAADAADLAAALASASPPRSPMRRPGGGSHSGEAGSMDSRSASPLCVERSGGSSSSVRSGGSSSSMRSDGSASASASASASSSLSLSPEGASYHRASNPSEYGLPYHVGCSSRAVAFRGQAAAEAQPPPFHGAVAQAGGQRPAKPAVAQGQLPDAAAGYLQRHGSFTSGGGRGGAGAYGGSAPGAAGPPLQLPNGRSASFHRRSASTSSTSLSSFPAGLGAGGSEAAAMQAAAAAGQQWPGSHSSSRSSLNWCAEPYATPCQQPYAAAQQAYMQLQLAVQPGQFVGRQPGGQRPQHWGRAPPAEAACDALAWQPQLVQQMRRVSSGWTLDGCPLPFQALPVPVPVPVPFVQHSGAGGRSGSGRFGAPAGGGGSYGASSAPSSAVQSPVADRCWQLGIPTSMPPPPPPLVLPVLDLQVRQRGWERAPLLPWRCRCRSAAAQLHCNTSGPLALRARPRVRPRFAPGGSRPTCPSAPGLWRSLPLPCGRCQRRWTTLPTSSGCCRRPRRAWCRRPPACRT